MARLQHRLSEYVLSFAALPFSAEGFGIGLALAASLMALHFYVLYATSQGLHRLAMSTCLLELVTCCYNRLTF